RDYPAFHEAMQSTLRAARLNDRRFRGEGVSIADTEALVPDLLTFTATLRANRDVEAWLETRFGAPKPRVWWALRQYGPFVHAVTGGPWSFGPRPAYVGARELGRPGDVASSVRTLVRRYLEGFGPATMPDIAQFGTIYRPPIQAALDSMADELVRHEGPGGTTLYDVPGGFLPPEDGPAPPRLLPMWDSTLLAYADRSRIVPPEYRTMVMRNNGDVLPTLLVDGYVAGVWRPTDGGIEATAFQSLPDDAWEGLETEARALFAFLADRDPAVYRRYGHWWPKLPTGEVRTLGR
ncbi:MAG TPA: winged helix DNA-binding domain-containing protein, partial [Candidatus Limnocylindrales bacterium]